VIDPSAHHPEPFGEALSYSSQRAAQMVSLVAAAAEVALRRRALNAARQAARDEQQRRQLQEQESAFRAQVRAGWAPALDARWLAQADLLQAGRAWGAAAPYADTDPEAAAALRRAEERLRTLHPYAMDRYDRLRSEGASPLDAMGEAAHLFDREPHARPGQPAPGRLAVEAGLSSADSAAEPGSAASPGEPATATEAPASLRPEASGQLARADAEERVAATAERARAADLGHAAVAPSAPARAADLKAARRDTLTADTAGAHAAADRTAAQLAAESFPYTAADGIRAAADGRLQPAQSSDRAATLQNTQRISTYP
jgi:hypothetical protein